MTCLTFLVLYLALHIVNGVTAFHFEGDGLACKVCVSKVTQMVRLGQ